MGINEALRLLAGTMVLTSLALGHFVHEGWYLLGVLVALNLVQSAFTRSCPAMGLLRRTGVRERHDRG